MRAFGQNDSSGPRGRQGRQPGPWCHGRCCRGAACSAAAARITPGLDHDPAPPDTHRQSSYSVILYFYTHFYTNNLIYYFLTPYFYTTFLLSFLYCIFIQIFCTKFSILDSSFYPKCSIFYDCTYLQYLKNVLVNDIFYIVIIFYTFFTLIFSMNILHFILIFCTKFS